MKYREAFQRRLRTCVEMFAELQREKPYVSSLYNHLIVV